MPAISQELQWQDVSGEVLWRYCKHAGVAADILAVIKDLPQDGFLDLWRHEEDNSLRLNVGDWISKPTLKAWRAALEPHCSHLEVADEGGSPDAAEWTKIAFCEPVEMPGQIKAAYSEAIRSLGEAGGYLPGGWTDAFGGPTPMSGMLATGLIGAGLGYGTGWVGERLLPRTWRRGKLPKALAVLGGLAGAAPGALMVGDNLRAGRGWNSGALTNMPPDNIERYLPDSPEFDPAAEQVPLDYKAACDAVQVELPPQVKEALQRRSGAMFRPAYQPEPVIPIDAFNDALYNDPRVAHRLGVPMQAATSGLLEAASANSSRPGMRLISPMDVARITAGMGTGYLSGAIVGKALGALIGMPEPAQDRLKSTGMWAGMVANLVPLAFGAR